MVAAQRVIPIESSDAMASFEWINIKKTPAYQDAKREVEDLIERATKPLTAKIAELEAEIAKLKA